MKTKAFMFTICVFTNNEAASSHVLLHQLRELHGHLPPNQQETLKQQLQELAEKLHMAAPPNEASTENDQITILPSTAITTTDAILNKTIVAAFAPIIVRYPASQLLGENKDQQSISDQLEHTHLIAAFLDRMQAKLPQLAPEAREFMKTKTFATQEFGRNLQNTLFTLQYLLKKQLETYKAIKSPSNIEKELSLIHI